MKQKQKQKKKNIFQVTEKIKGLTLKLRPGEAFVSDDGQFIVANTKQVAIEITIKDKNFKKEE